jgi:hypothetical protein
MIHVRPSRILIYALVALSALYIAPAGAAAIDETPPIVVLQSDPDVTDNGAWGYGVWTNKTVFLEITARDEESGVSKTEYAVSPAAVEEFTWAEGPEFSVSPSGKNGEWWVRYRATNGDGVTGAWWGMEDVAAKDYFIGIINFDSQKPTTEAPYSATGRRGRTATLRYRVTDAEPNGGTGGEVTIKIRNRARKVVKTLGPVAAPLNADWRSKVAVPRRWKPGTYRFYIYATDSVGNKQANVASNKLIVR